MEAPYDGYLKEWIEFIAYWQSYGATPAQIARKLLERGVKTPGDRGSRRQRIESIAASVRYVQKRLS